MADIKLDLRRSVLYSNVKKLLTAENGDNNTVDGHDNFIKQLDLNISVWSALEEVDLKSIEKPVNEGHRQLSTDPEASFRDAIENIDEHDSNSAGTLLANFDKRVSTKKQNHKSSSEVLRVINDEIQNINNQQLQSEYPDITNSEMWNKIKKPQLDNNQDDLPQVFLSHSYDDRFYTTCLFEYFRHRGIFLYIDWQNQGRIDYGKDLRASLAKELERFSQILFLPNINDQFNWYGKGHIKPWCAWELGVFYERKPNYKDQQFFIDIYGNTYKNMHTDGLKKANKIVDRMIVE